MQRLRERTGASSPAQRRAVLVQGALLMALVAIDGSPGWQLLRAGAVVVLTWAALRFGNRRGWVGIAVGTTAGAIGTSVGLGIGVFHLTHGYAGPRAVLGLGCLVTGLVLLGASAVGLVRALRGWWRLLAVPAALALAAFVVLPVSQGVAATNAPHAELGTRTPADVGLSAAEVAFETSDGVRLAGWWVPSEHGAAVVVSHGASSTRTSVLDQAAVLARHGYGVLVVDARGHGGSAGRPMAFGWYGEADLAAAVSFVVGQPDVDPDRVGLLGLSMGGEESIGAAAADPRVRAVVAEGATGRGLADKGWLPEHWRGWLQRGIDAILYGTADLLTAASPPPSLRASVRAAAPAPVLLVAGGAVLGGAEEDAGAWIRDGSPSTVTLWVVPGAGHTDALATDPGGWARTVVGFLDDALRG